MKQLIFLAACAAALAGCSAANLEETKAAAPQRFKELGFEVVGYEGYQWGPHVWPGYGGAYVWFTLRRNPDNGITYTGSMQKWGGEFHNAHMRAYEAKNP